MSKYKIRIATRLVALCLLGCGGDGAEQLKGGDASLDGATDAGEGLVDGGSAPENDGASDGLDADLSDGDASGGDLTDADLADASADAATSAVAPSLTLLGAAELVLDCGDTYADPGAEAVDALGTPVTVEVLDSELVSTAAPGQFTVRYRATVGELSSEVERTVLVCGQACGELGKEPITLAGWTPIQYEQDSQPDANWILSEDLLSVEQRVNADASIFLADFDATDIAIEGRWRMTSTSDDDFVGFVFGYQDRGHFYLFDWKRGTQTYMGGTAEAGMTLKIVNAAVPDGGVVETQLSTADLWYSTGTESVSIMQKDGAPLRNDIPWAFNINYFFFLEFHAGRFRIDVRDEEGVVLESWSVEDDTYTSGAFGFYNYSQGPVTYESFTRRATPVACSTLEM